MIDPSLVLPWVGEKWYLGLRNTYRPVYWIYATYGQIVLVLITLSFTAALLLDPALHTLLINRAEKPT